MFYFGQVDRTWFRLDPVGLGWIVMIGSGLLKLDCNGFDLERSGLLDCAGLLSKLSKLSLNSVIKHRIPFGSLFFHAISVLMITFKHFRIDVH